MPDGVRDLERPLSLGDLDRLSFGDLDLSLGDLALGDLVLSLGDLGGSSCGVGVGSLLCSLSAGVSGLSTGIWWQKRQPCIVLSWVQKIFIEGVYWGPLGEGAGLGDEGQRVKARGQIVKFRGGEGWVMKVRGGEGQGQES